MPPRVLHDPDASASSRQARRLQIAASRTVTAVFAGAYRSAFRGRGIEFDEVREYQPGDDIRSIDWNVTARLGRPFVKRFVEERELTVLFLIDRSPSMRFGTVRATKLDAAAESCALLAFAALRSHDKTGLVCAGDGTFSYLRPGKGTRHTLRLVREAAGAEAAGAGDGPRFQAAGARESGLARALGHLERVLSGRAVVCIFSDFLSPLPFDSLALLACRHDVVAVSVSDPAERELPECGLVALSDPVTGATLCLDSGDPVLLRSFRERAENKRAKARGEIARSGADYLELSTDRSPVQPLIEFFLRRRRGRGA